MVNAVQVYRGITYATAARFRPPVPMPMTTEPLLEVRFGPAAPQNPDRLDYMWGEVLADNCDEVCLTLNIWTPARDEARRPVMVWIHGGAFIIGSGSWGWYEGTRLVERGDVVLVTLNYRLGAFGFLDLGEIGGIEYSESANCGFLDQIAALEWVRDHIERFGGDPNNVTVFGESAGGISISCHLACSRSRGLFRRAICMSGPPSMVRPQSISRRVTARLMGYAGVTTLDQLLALPMQCLLAAQDRTIRSADFLGELLFGPTVGGDTLPRFPLHAIRDGSAADVTLLTGTTLDEARLWSLYNPILRWIPVAALNRWLNAMEISPAELRAAYREARPELRGGNLTMAVAGDSLFWLSTIRLAEAQVIHRPADTRMYLIAWQTPVLGGRLGAPHGVETPFIFGNLDARGANFMIGDAPEQAADREAIAAALQRAWVAFARTGNPWHDGLPDWPAYDASNRPTMVFDRSCVVHNDPNEPVRRVWDRVPFDGVHPAVDQLPRIKDIFWFLAVRGAGMLLLVVFLILLIVWLVASAA